MMQHETNLALEIENARQIVTQSVARADRSEIGQFLTPLPIARFMASCVTRSCFQARILDPGAGAGILCATLVEQLCSRGDKPESIEVVAYEMDEEVLPHLRNAMGLCHNACQAAGISFKGIIKPTDFIADGLAEIDGGLFARTGRRFSHVIQNPPYKKISSDSECRRRLNAAGFETSNLYAAFVWLSLALLAPGGELVAITPRSFCNGPYFKRFRKALLEQMALRRIHLFRSRKEAFADDAVLQENIIFYGIKGEAQPERVTVSASDGPSFTGTSERVLAFRHMVYPDDAEAFIHLAEDDQGEAMLRQASPFPATLNDLGLEVSTGRVVDFRVRDFLRPVFQPETAPLLYPCHLQAGSIRWPLPDGKKPNAIAITQQTQGLLVENGFYVLVKRFSAKEERRRITAALYDPHFIATDRVGFENHLNYYHAGGKPLPATLAKGLMVFLNATACDRHFRLFSGHTQVNATDLRKMHYPTHEQLLRLGTMETVRLPEQNEIDALIERVCGRNG